MTQPTITKEFEFFIREVITEKLTEAFPTGTPGELRTRAEQKKIYKNFKNYLNNELKIDRKFIEDLITKEIRKVVAEQFNINEGYQFKDIIQDSILKLVGKDRIRTYVKDAVSEDVLNKLKFTISLK